MVPAAGLVIVENARQRIPRARAAITSTAVADALDYVHRAIAAAPGLGGGHGPINHTVPPLLSP